MVRGREPGKKNRTTPPLPLSKALAVAQVVAHEASGRKVSKLTLAELLKSTPTSSVFRDLVASSRLYGLSSGGINATEYDLTSAGHDVTSDDPDVRDAALKATVMQVPAYKLFFETYAGKKVPTERPLREFLLGEAQVPEAYLEECVANLLDDAATAGLVRKVGNADWVDLTGTPAPSMNSSQGEDEETHDDLADDDADFDNDDPLVIKRPPTPPNTPDVTKKKRPNKLFIGHGRNKKPLEQLTKMLRDLGIPHLVAEDEPNAGRPISKKVRDTMDQCGAAILIFSADVEYFDKDQKSVWRPSENVSHELGASAVMYEDRIIIFKEEDVTLASNFSGIVHIGFEKDRLDAKMNELLRELVALKILKISVDDD